MKLHILGCGDAFGNGGRNQSGYLVEAADRLFLMDCGPTALLAMKRAGFDPRRLDVVFLSHLHGDHFGGLPFFFISYLYENPRDQPLHIAGPPGSEEKVSQLYSVMYGGDVPPIRFHILQPDRAERILGIHVLPSCSPSDSGNFPRAKNHLRGQTDSLFGRLRLDRSFSIACSWSGPLLCECSFYEQDSANHLNYKTLRKTSRVWNAGS